MEAINSIMSRRSVRKYSGKRISDSDLETILKAGQSGPSCVNSRDWAFFITRDKSVLSKIADANGPYSEMLKHASVGIVVCGDLSLAYSDAPDYWIIDASIAAQNIILAANALGIGSVWLGTYPQLERVNEIKSILNFPENIVPLAVISLGYPASDKTTEPRCLYEPEKVHFEKW